MFFPSPSTVNCFFCKCILFGNIGSNGCNEKMACDRALRCFKSTMLSHDLAPSGISGPAVTLPLSFGCRARPRKALSQSLRLGQWIQPTSATAHRLPWQLFNFSGAMCFIATQLLRCLSHVTIFLPNQADSVDALEELLERSAGTNTSDSQLNRHSTAHLNLEPESYKYVYKIIQIIYKARSLTWQCSKMDGLPDLFGA